MKQLSLFDTTSSRSLDIKAKRLAQIAQARKARPCGGKRRRTATLLLYPREELCISDRLPLLDFLER
jgi:hypothetical protein